MKVLAVTMSVRDYAPCTYWRDCVDFVDRIVYKNFWHMEAHELSRKFFLDHDYTHFLFLAEDVVVTPDQIKLIIKDAEENGFKVIAGYSNVDFMDGGRANISFNDLRKVRVYSRHQYNHPRLVDVLTGKYGYPFIEVKFQGNTLTLIERSVVEKLSFKPYTYTLLPLYRKVFVCDKPFGIMFDLQMCNELLDMNVPITVDVRLFCPHFAFGLGVISLKGKERTVSFYDSSKGEWSVLAKLPPYG